MITISSLSVSSTSSQALRFRLSRIGLGKLIPTELPHFTSLARAVGATKKGVNQLIERLNGTVRDRGRVMRGMDHDESAQKLLDGNRIFYNFVRPHMGLGNKTPAQKLAVSVLTDRINGLG